MPVTCWLRVSIVDGDRSRNSDPGDVTSPTPPASPPTHHRVASREENPNVFLRLTHGTNVGNEPLPDRGVIHPFQGKVTVVVLVNARLRYHSTYRLVCCLIQLLFSLKGTNSLTLPRDKNQVYQLYVTIIYQLKSN